MKDVTIKICCGTTCYILGNYQLLSSLASLPAGMQRRVEVIGSACLGSCCKPEVGRPPFVKVNQRLITQATEETVLAAIRDALEA